jgi:hypothetical protein
MSDEVERLDAALNRQRTGARVEDLSPALRDLVEMATVIGDAYHAGCLTTADRERIYAEAVLRLETALGSRRLWQRLDGRGVAVIGGAAAVTAIAAAIGVRLIIGRRGHRLHLATT